MPKIHGEFNVRRSAEPSCDLGDGVEAMHSRFDKVFNGPLDAISVVHMLAVVTPTPGSAAYVAIERIVGSIDGRSGTFCMQHSGTMDRGAPSLTVSVIPDSGTDALAGLRGTLVIDIVDGKHFYTFDYSLPD
jgi:Protein of unknown function (DUF3224)